MKQVFFTVLALVLGFAAVFAATPAVAAESVVAHVRLPGVYYGDRAATDATINVGEPFHHWVVTESTPIPSGAVVLRVVKVGDDLKPGKQGALDGKTHNRLYSGPSE